jgi:hypothetical protein
MYKPRVVADSRLHLSLGRMAANISTNLTPGSNMSTYRKVHGKYDLLALAVRKCTGSAG